MSQITNYNSTSIPFSLLIIGTKKKNQNTKSINKLGSTINLNQERNYYKIKLHLVINIDKVQLINGW